MAASPYPIDPALTAIAIAYKNPGYIADLVVPRVTVGKQAFKFMQYGVDTFFNTPDTLIGRRSAASQVTMDGTEVSDATDDHGLEGGVPKADVDNADERYDPLGNQTSLLMELVAIRREMRAAALVFSAATYDAGLRATLAGTDQFSDPASGPIKRINAALDMPLMRPTQMTFGQYGWTQFRSNPEIVEAVLGTGAKKGVVKREAVAELFEVEEVIVGQARGNTAKRGQSPSLARLWGNHLALTYKAPVLSTESATFAATFQWGQPFASQRDLKPGEMGLRGGTAVLVGESVRERLVAGQAGYFFENAFG